MDDGSTRTKPADAAHDVAIARDIAAVARLPVVQRILATMARMTGMRFTAVARVTDRQWIACAVHDDIAFGLVPGGELELETTICNEIRQHRQAVVFGDARAHPRYAHHPTPAKYGFQSYISIPILRHDGEFFGTLCAIDPLPAKLDDPTVIATLELFAELIASQLDLEDRIDASDRALAAEQEEARVRERFIAVLGHDLRTPLQSIGIGTDLLAMAPLEPKWQSAVQRMRRSVTRMTQLIDAMLDFARGRLGRGLGVDITVNDALCDALTHVVDEARAANPSREILFDCTVMDAFACDARRLAQLLANLLNNALVHGTADAPVHVDARRDETSFAMSVRNAGAPIPEAQRARLFQPFVRGDAARLHDSSGLGLGLYIASEIARAHGGTIAFTSDENVTCFMFRMAIAPR